MKGKDPRDAHFITSRICGICGDNHATCAIYAQNMAFGIRPPAMAEWIVNLGEAAEYMFDHNIFQDNLVGVDFCEQMVKETNPTVLAKAEKTAAPHGDLHGYRTIADIMRALNPFTGAFYREALQMSRMTREMFCLMEGRHVHPSTLYPGGVGTVPTVQLFTDYLVRLMKYVEFMKKVVPLHDDLFDFFYEALPGYEEVGRRRDPARLLGIVQQPGRLRLHLREHDRRGAARCTSRPASSSTASWSRPTWSTSTSTSASCSGSSFYDDWAGRRDVREDRPARQPGRPAAPVEPDDDPAAAEARLRRQVHLGDVAALVRQADRRASGARHRRRADRALLGDGARRPGGHRLRQGDRAAASRSTCRRPMSLPEVEFEWKIPKWSNTIERDRARTYFQAYAAAAALYFVEQALAGAARRPDQDVDRLQGAERGDRLRLPRGGARRALAPRRHPRRQDRQLPPVPADAVERQPARHLRHAGAVRGRGAEHADLRGERPGQLQGHRHHARRCGASIRACRAASTCISATARCSRRATRRCSACSRSGHGRSHARRSAEPARTAEIASLVEAMQRVADPSVRAVAEELVQSVLELHRAGLERAIGLIARRKPGGSALVDGSRSDDLVGEPAAPARLHPVDLETRVRKAVARLQTVAAQARRRRRTASTSATAPSRLQVTDAGRDAARRRRSPQSVEDALYEAAPDLTALVIERPPDTRRRWVHSALGAAHAGARRAAVREDRSSEERHAMSTSDKPPEPDHRARHTQG